MERAFAQQIETLPGQTLLSECQSYKPGLGFSCNALDIGLDSYVRCLAKDIECPFSVPYADSIFCKCPPRVYLAKNLRE